MKVTEYGKEKVAEGDSFLVYDGNGVSKKLSAKEAYLKLVDMNPDHVAVHRSEFRGKYLGNRVSEDQIKTIKDGRFKDIWVGDYWTYDDGSTWVVADFNYFQKTGENEHRVPSNHIVIIQKEITDKNKPHLLSGNSTLQTGITGETYFNGIQNQAFKVPYDLSHGNVLTPEQRLNGNIVGSHLPGGTVSYYEKPVVLHASSIFGGATKFVSRPSIGTGKDIELSGETEMLGILALFDLAGPEYAFMSKSYWLRNLYPDGYLIVNANGYETGTGPSSKIFWRPAFIIG